MPSNKRLKLKNFIMTNFGCGCGTKKTMDAFEPMPDYKTSPDPKPRRSPSSNDECSSYCSGRISPFLKISDSFAIEKNSEDPYHDFRQSMTQMILEKDIYARDDLQQLLSCFLELNSPHHHGVIVQAFMEIWNDGILMSNMLSELTGAVTTCPSIIIGYLLRPNLVEGKEWESIAAKCLKSFIKLVKIDGSYFDRPCPILLPHIIIHCQSKLHLQLSKFLQEHPNIIVVDHPDDIEQLFYRDTMLEHVESLGIRQVGIPKQKFLNDENGFIDLITEMAQKGQGLQVPLIIKTRDAGGSKASHEMNFAKTIDHLVELKNTHTISFPFVVQEFVDHGDFIVKVYVLGSQVRGVVRHSTGDSCHWKEENNKVVTKYGNRRQSIEPAPEISESDVARVMPPPELMKQMAYGLQNKLKLKAFNFDVIKVPIYCGQHEYLIVDINHFPGYSKLDNYVDLMTDFFHEIAQPLMRDIMRSIHE